MNIKEWLSQAYQIEVEIEALKEQLEILNEEFLERRDELSKITKDKYAKLYEYIEQIIKKRSSGRELILNTINNLPEEIHKTIIYEHCVNNKPFYLIATQINYSDRHTQFLHLQALKEIKKIINEQNIKIPNICEKA